MLITIRLDPFRDYQIAEIACYVIAVAGLTALVGLSGQISLGNGAFMAIGAYSAALLMLHLHWPLAAVLVASTVITALSGAVVGVAAARLRGPYLAGATLLLAVALPSLALSDNSLFGGDQGLTCGGQHARLPRPQLPADPLAGLADLWLRADHPGPAGQPGAQPGRPVLAGGRRRRGGRRAGRAERGPAPGARVRGQRGVCRAWPACCWR